MCPPATICVFITHTHTHTLEMYIDVYVYICVHVYIYTHTHVYMYIHMCVCVCVCVCVYYTDIEVAQELGLLLEILKVKHSWRLIIELAMVAAHHKVLLIP
jgi:hypothetical protein